MAFTLVNENIQRVSPDFISGDFKRVIEDHLSVISNDSENTVISITPVQAIRFVGDFEGLLRELEFDARYFYVLTRLNGLLSSIDYKGDFEEIRVPSFSFIESLMAKFKSTR